jgi:hypothetical protein
MTDKNLEARYTAHLLMHASVDLRREGPNGAWIARFTNAKKAVLAEGGTIPEVLRKLAEMLE